MKFIHRCGNVVHIYKQGTSVRSNRSMKVDIGLSLCFWNGSVTENTDGKQLCKLCKRIYLKNHTEDDLFTELI